MAKTAGRPPCGSCSTPSISSNLSSWLGSRRSAFAAAARGDGAARQIVSDAADALATTMATIAAADVVGPIVLGGSILSQQPAIADAVVAAAQRCGVAGPVSTVPDGMVGAAVLALRHGGATVDEAVFARIRSSLAALR